MSIIRLFLLSGLIALWLAPAVAADCAPKRAFDDVYRLADRALATRQMTDRQVLTSLGTAVERFETLNVRTRLQSNDLGGYVPLVFRVLAELRALSRGAAAASLRPSDLADLRAVLTRLCDEAPADSASSDEQRRLPALGHVFDAPGHSGPENGTILRSYVMLGSLPFVVFVTCSTIFVALRAYRYAFSFMHSRRSCKLPAIMQVGPLAVEGFVILLGAKGSRFQATQRNDIQAIETLLQSRATLPETILTIAGQSHDVQLHLVKAPYCVSYFDVPLGRTALQALFAKSQVAPRLVPKVRTRSNLSQINPLLHRGRAPG